MKGNPPRLPADPSVLRPSVGPVGPLGSKQKAFAASQIRILSLACGRIPMGRVDLPTFTISKSTKCRQIYQSHGSYETWFWI